ncbi:unnamed protein product [Brassica oleracea]
MSILKNIRPILQWVVVALPKNLAKIAEGASHLADWLATVGFIIVIYHVITIFKLKRRFNDFGALDSLISITIAFTEELIYPKPVLQNCVNSRLPSIHGDERAQS